MLTHERNNDYTKDQNAPNGRTPNISVANFSAVCHDTNDCYKKKRLQYTRPTSPTNDIM